MWELEALKLLAKNETVPGVALRDVISELERTQAKLELIKKSNQELKKALAAANADADALADELKLEQNPGYTCEALHDHFARIGGER